MPELKQGAHYSGTFILKRPATVDRHGRKRWVLRCMNCGNELIVLEVNLKRRTMAMKCRIC